MQNSESQITSFVCKEKLNENSEEVKGVRVVHT